MGIEVFIGRRGRFKVKGHDQERGEVGGGDVDLRVGQSGEEVGPRGRGGAAVQVGRQVEKDKTTVKNRTGRDEVKEPERGCEGGGREDFLLDHSEARLAGGRSKEGNGKEAEEGEQPRARARPSPR